MKFAPGSSGDRVVTRTGEEETPNLGSLENEVRSISVRTGIPLTALRLSGGGWLSLSADERAMLGELAEIVGARAGVTGVVVDTVGAAAGNEGGSRRVLRVHFDPASPEARTVEWISEKRGEPPSSFLAALEDAVVWPLIVRAGEGGELLLGVDMRKLTLALKHRLEELPEIDFAQLNYRLETSGS